MAISGVADADVESAAKTYGKSRKEMAAALGGYTYQTKSAATADGGSKLLNVTWTNLHGLVTIEWGDGTYTQYNGSAGAGSHTYATNGSKTIYIRSAGSIITKTQALA